MQQKRFGSQLWSKVESEKRKGQGVLSEHGKHDGRRKETVGGTGLLKLKALLLFFCMGQNGLNVSATPTGWGGAARHPYVSAVPKFHAPGRSARVQGTACAHTFVRYPDLLPSTVTNTPEPGGCGSGNSIVSLSSVAGCGLSSSSTGGFAATPGVQKRSAHAMSRGRLPRTRAQNYEKQNLIHSEVGCTLGGVWSICAMRECTDVTQAARLRAARTNAPERRRARMMLP